MSEDNQGGVMPSGAMISNPESGDTPQDSQHDITASQAPAVDLQSPEQESEQSDTDSAETDDKDWKAEADKWKALARKHEANAKGSKGLRDEVTQLREQAENHEASIAEATSALAAERLHTRLARAGMSESDAAALIEHIDTNRLLDNGKPSAKAIESVAASLTRSLGRASVDDDQGQRSSDPQFSADSWLRRKARS